MDVKGPKLKTRLLPPKASHFQTDNSISRCSASATCYRGHSFSDIFQRTRQRSGNAERRLRAPGRIRDAVSKETVLERVDDEV